MNFASFLFFTLVTSTTSESDMTLKASCEDLINMRIVKDIADTCAAVHAKTNCKKRFERAVNSVKFDGPPQDNYSLDVVCNYMMKHFNLPFKCEQLNRVEDLMVRINSQLINNQYGWLSDEPYNIYQFNPRLYRIYVLATCFPTKTNK